MKTRYIIITLLFHLMLCFVPMMASYLVILENIFVEKLKL